MKRVTISVLTILAVIFMAFFSLEVKSQSIPVSDNREKIVVLFSDALENVRTRFGVSKLEFDVFERFETNPIHLLKASAMAEARKHEFDPALLPGIGKEAEKNLALLYKKFLSVEKQYPSSVDEYRHTHSITSSNPCDSTGCSNIGFENGNLSSWYGYYAENNSTITNVVINNVTGGLLGAVTEACSDPLVITNMSSTVGIRDTSLSNDYQISITSSGYDYVVPTIPRVSPWGGSHSVMLGDSQIVGQGAAILSKTFLVTANNSNLTYQYAVFLNNPLHVPTQQPFFIVAILDENGDTIPNCGEYNVVSGYGIKGFDSTQFSGYDGVDKVYYRNWTIVNVPLKNYIGQCITLVFEIADCALEGHFGYAYVDASCSPSSIISSSPNFCGQDSISLSAPPGAPDYTWSGPVGGIIGSSSSQTVWVDSAGIYRVVIIPVTGVSCSDTLYDTIGKLPGPPPIPDFYTTSACVGQPTHFINTSTDTAGADFYWDFYNIGIYNDTGIVNPYWTYASPGTYTVNLQEVYNGCGSDTSIIVKVYNSVIGGFTAVNSACAGDLVTMTNTSTGATGYLWNYGDPAGGTNDTSDVVNGSYTYANPGTYTITLVSRNAGSCPDTTREVITVTSFPRPVISGLDSVCPNYDDLLTVTGGTTYAWSTGATASSVSVSSSVTETITVQAFNGSLCSHDTTFIMHVVSTSPVITASKNAMCPGDSVTLSASGGSNYRWSTSSTLTTITVSPASTTTYTLYSTTGNCTDSTTVKITVLTAVTSIIRISKDTICAGSSTTITVLSSYGGLPLTYSWSTGATTSAITISPDTATTYSILISNGDCSKDTSFTIFVKFTPTVIVTGSLSDTLCIGQSVALNVSGATSYGWNPSTGLSCFNCPDPIATPTETTNYIVTGTDTDGCSNSKTIKVLVEFPPVLGPIPNQYICSGNPATLIANEISGTEGNYTWEPGGSTGATLTEYPAVTTAYMVTCVNRCGTSSAYDTVFVTPAPTPLFSANIYSGCSPLCIQFKDASTVSHGSITQWIWSFGNGDSSHLKNPLYCYPQSGAFSVIETVIAADGCSASLKRVQLITVFNKPVANFTYSPQIINFLEPTVQFTDESTDTYGILYYLWNFGDGQVTGAENSLSNPVHTYQDTGTYCPQLVIVNTKGCVDTTIKCLEVEPIYSIYIPNAFSPNGDGLNEIFIPKGNYIKNFEMYIFDRWGQELFHSTNINNGWNGTVKGGNIICQEDSYVYNISVTDWKNIQHTYVGELTLIK